MKNSNDIGKWIEKITSKKGNLVEQKKWLGIHTWYS